jgi:hypothetical protein
VGRLFRSDPLRLLGYTRIPGRSHGERDGELRVKAVNHIEAKEDRYMQPLFGHRNLL